MDDLIFSQRYGGAAVPPQLAINELSRRLRALLWGVVHQSMSGSIQSGYDIRFFVNPWEAILRDFHVKMLHGMADEFTQGATKHIEQWRRYFESGDINLVGDVTEFLLRNSQFPATDKASLAAAWVEGRSAYRVIDSRSLVPVGSKEQGDAIESALAAAASKGISGAKSHLIAAGEALRDGEWAGSVRNSISAVEAAAKGIVGGEPKLSDALAALEKSAPIHGALRKALEALYGYASDEKGVRHALVFKGVSAVDEADALFMLGACASAVSYLLAKVAASGNKNSVQQK